MQRSASISYRMISTSDFGSLKPFLKQHRLTILKCVTNSLLGNEENF